MKKKKMVSSGSMTGTLILYYIGWGIIFGFVSINAINIMANILKQFITTVNIIGGYILLAIVVSAICVLFNYLTIRNSISSSFRKKGIQKGDVSKVLNNIIILLIVYIICFSIPFVISTVGDLNETIEYYEERIENIVNIEDLYGTTIASEKIEDLEKIISETKIAVYVSMPIEIIIIAFSDFAMYFVYKKYMMKEVEKQLETDFEE